MLNSNMVFNKIERTTRAKAGRYSGFFLFSGVASLINLSIPLVVSRFNDASLQRDKIMECLLF